MNQQEQTEGTEPGIRKKVRPVGGRKTFGAVRDESRRTVLRCGIALVCDLCLLCFFLFIEWSTHMKNSCPGYFFCAFSLSFFDCATTTPIIKKPAKIAATLMYNPVVGGWKRQVIWCSPGGRCSPRIR